MGSCKSGGKGAGAGASANQISSLVSRVNNPQTKEDYILKLKIIAENGQSGYTVKVETSEWNNYGKSRTYLKLNSYRESDGKYHHSKDYGYYDNNSGDYVKPKGTNGLDSSKIYTASGVVMSDDDIKSALQSLMKRGEV